VVGEPEVVARAQQQYGATVEQDPGSLRSRDGARPSPQPLLLEPYERAIDRVAVPLTAEDRVKGVERRTIPRARGGLRAPSTILVGWAMSDDTPER